MANFLNRLNGWQRIGVLLSVAWAIYGLTLVDRQDERARQSANTAFGSCRDQALNRDWKLKENSLMESYLGRTPNPPREPTLTSDLLECGNQQGLKYRRIHDDELLNFFLYCILPIPLGWLAIYKGIATLKWVRAGFDLGKDS